MLVLSESHLALSPTAFDKAWADDPSILVLPDGLTDEFWVHARLGLLSSDLQRGHLLLWSRCATGRPRLSIGSKSRMRAQAQCLGRVQGLQAVERVLITLPLSSPFALVNQWIWAMYAGAKRSVLPARVDAQELSKSGSTLLCLDESQATSLIERFPGQHFLAITRVCLVNTGPAQPWLSALQALFPNAAFYGGEGSSEAMTYVTMRPLGSPRSERCDPLAGVEFRQLPEGGRGFSSRYAALAKIDDHALHRLDPDHCFACPASMGTGSRLRAA